MGSFVMAGEGQDSKLEPVLDASLLVLGAHSVGESPAVVGAHASIVVSAQEEDASWRKTVGQEGEVVPA